MTVNVRKMQELILLLAVWGSHNKHIKADYFLEKPANLLSAITSEKFY